MIIVAVPLGILIGSVSGAVAILFLRTMVRNKPKSSKTVVALGTELLSLPSFWFGGSWITSKILENLDMDKILPVYILSLCVTFLIIFVYPAFWLVVRVAQDIRQVD